MDIDLLEFVKQHHIKTPNITSVNSDTIELYKQAGFPHQANYLQKTVSDKALVDREHINLRIPHFKNGVLNRYKWTKRYGIFTLALWLASTIYVPLVIIAAFVSTGLLITAGILDDNWRNSSYKHIKIKWNKYLVECYPNQYNGYVLPQIAEAVIVAKNKGLTPRIWLAGTEKEVTELVDMQVIDPLLVGYDKSENYVALLAIWGHDIEDLHKYFS